MKSKTINSLNYAAKVIADDIATAARDGALLCKEVNGAVNPPSLADFIAMRETIRRMNPHFSYITGINFTNVVKTTQQFNYVANEVLNKLRRTGWFFRQNKPSALKQQTFKFD